jgi:peroxiredoxin
MSEKSIAELLQDITDKSRALDVPLSVRLKLVADEVRRLSPEFADVVDRMVARLEGSGVGQNAPAVGEPMPTFILPDEQGRLVCLDDLTRHGPVVVAFYRGHWCPYCQLCMDGIASIAKEIFQLGGGIVAISPETHRYGAELKEYANAPFPVLADIDGGYALQLNLLFWVGDEKREAMKAGGFDISLFQGNETWMLPVPATFVVGADGLVNARWIDPDYRRRADLDDILEAVRRSQQPAESRLKSRIAFG